MKKSVITALLVVGVGGGAGYYFQQGASGTNVDIEKYINDIVNTTKDNPYRVGSFTGGLNDIGIEWTADKKEGDVITGMLKEKKYNLISVPTKSIVKKGEISYSGDNFDYQVTTDFLLKEIKINNNLDDVSEFFAKLKAEVVEKTYIKNSGDLVSIFDTGAINYSEDNDSFSTEGIKIVSKGNFQKGISQSNYDITEMNFKSDDFDFLLKPFSGEIKKTDSQVKQTTTSTSFQITNNKKEKIIVDLSASTGNSEIKKKLPSGIMLGAENAVIKEIKISKDDQEKVRFNDFTYQASVLENTSNTYDLSAGISSKIKIKDFDFFMLMLANNMKEINQGGDVDMTFDLQDIKLIGGFTQLSKEALNNITALNNLNIDINDDVNKAAMPHLKKLFKTLQSTDSAFDFDIIIGTNKGNINSNIKYSLSEEGKKTSLDNLEAALENSNSKQLIQYFNMGMSLSVDESVIKALALDKSLMAVTVMGFAEYKNGKLSSTLSLKDGKVTMNGREIPNIL